MRNKSSAATMARLLEHARYEVLPTASTEDKLLEHVPRDLRSRSRRRRARGSRRPSTWPSG